MRTNLFIFLFVVMTNVSAQTAYKKGEVLKYKISYSNFLSAGNATLEVKETFHNGELAHHIIGKGETTGVIGWFFKVRDKYQSYIDKPSLLPYRFIRQIDEGGHTKDKEILFDQVNRTAKVINHKKKTEETYTTNAEVQDMISTLYYLRNYDISTMKDGDEIALTMFFDQTNYNFKLRLLGRETIKTKFGKVKAVKFRPIVQAGRVFKEEESLTVWVSDDKNKIPLKLKASLAVGSMNGDLDGYKGLANPFPIIF